MPSRNTPPCFIPSLFTVLRLCFQYRRHTTNAAKRRRSSTLAATADSRNERIGTFVESHHVGEPMTMRSYSRSVTEVGIPILAGDVAAPQGSFRVPRGTDAASESSRSAWHIADPGTR